MNYATTVLTALFLTSAGMAALSLAIDRHHRQAYNDEVPPRLRKRLRVAGALLLALAIAPCVRLWGPGAGVVAWTGMLTVGALLSAGLLPYWPRKLAPLAGCAAALGVIGLGALAFS